jgi:hypothetical protein
MREIINAYKILVETSGGERTLARLRRRLEENIKIDLTKIRFGFVGWILKAQDT